MTVRSIILGLLGAAFVCGFCFLNDWVLRQTYLVGNSMPASIYGVLVLAAVLMPLVLGRFTLKGRELAVILALTLAAASIPGGGLMRTLIPTLVMPHHLVKTRPAWSTWNVVEQVPKQMLTDVSRDEDRVVNGYVQGLGQGDEHIRLRDVPWRAWVRPLAFWLPFVITLWSALIALAVALHRQWSGNEHLPYPIATFTAALLPHADGAPNPVLRERLFWVGAGCVLAIHLNNFAAAWFPRILIAVPTRYDFTPLGKLFPVLVEGGGSMLLRPHIYIIIIGLAYFIPSDVSFSFGVGPFLWHTLMGIAAIYGIDLMSPAEGTSYFSLKPQSFALFGANVGVLVSLMYTGRHYYWNLLAGAAGRRSAADPGDTPVRAFRLFLILALLLVLQISLAGVEPWLAVLYTGIMLMGFVVLGRIIAETGLIYLKCYFWPCSVLWGLFGARTIGLRQLLIMMLLTTVLFIDPREALMPFMVNSLKVLELRRQSIGRPALACVAAVLLGLGVALPVTLYLKYDMGSATGDSWATITVPRVAFDNVVAIQQKLAHQGLAGDGVPTGMMDRLAALSPAPICVVSAAAGFVLVVSFSWARLRWTRWPLHPLMFVTWCSTPLRWMAVSYLIGWVVKTLVTRYGGSRVYNRLKPLMIGLIAGEILGALFPSIVGALYFFITNEQPRMFNVIPG